MTLFFAKELFAWLIGRRERFRIQGNSMRPKIDDRDIVFIAAGRDCQIGDIVIARHPYKHTQVIKYVSDINLAGYVELRSPEGTDSRQFGRIPINQIIGRVTMNLTKRKSLIRENLG